MTKPRNNLITQKAFADEIGVTKQYIYKLVKKGLIVLESKKVNKKKALKAMKKAADLTRKSVVNPHPVDMDSVTKYVDNGNPNLSLVAARAKERHYKAEIAKIEYQEKAGKMIDREKYDAALLSQLAKSHTIIKNHVLSIPTRISILWPDPNTRPELKALLEKEVREILTDMSTPDIEAAKEGT